MKLLADHLRSETGLRVVAKTPPDTGPSWVRLTQLAAPQAPNSKADTVVAYYFQLDCFASEDGGEPEAENMAIAVCAAVIGIDASVSETTAGRIENGGFYNPDTNFTPARERMIVTATVFAR